jgi:hypothetical protein
MAAITRHPNWQRPEDIRELFTALGIGQFVMPLAIQYAFFLPRTTDPYAQGVIILVKGIQRTLNRRGADLVVDGGLGPKTAAMIERVSGPDWQNKTWIQIAGDVIAAKPIRKDAQFALPHISLGTTFVGDVVASPLPLIALAAVGWWVWKNK